MEYFSAINKNGNIQFASKWMELKKIIPSEVTRAQKDKLHMFSLIFGS